MKITNNRLNESHDEQLRFPFIRVNGLDFSRRITAKYGYFVKPRRFLSLVFRRLTGNRNLKINANIYVTRVISNKFTQYLNIFRNVIEQPDQTEISNIRTDNLLFQGFFPLQILKGRNEVREAKKDYMQPYSITSSCKAGWPIMTRTTHPTTILKILHPRNVLSGKTGSLPVDPLMSRFNQENNASFLQAKFESPKIADFSTTTHSTSSSFHQEGSIRDRIIHPRIPDTGFEPPGPVSGSMKPHLSSSLFKQDSPAPKIGKQSIISSTKSIPEIPKTSPQQIHEESALQYPNDPSIKLESRSSKEIIHKLRSSTPVKKVNNSLEPFVFKKPGKLAMDENAEPISVLDLTTKKEGREWVPVIQLRNNFAQEHSTFLENVKRKYPPINKEEVFSNNLTKLSARSLDPDRKIDMSIRSLQQADAKFQHINNRQETTQLNQHELKKDITTRISNLIMRKPISHNIEQSSKYISEDINRSINMKNISTVLTESNISKKDETNIIADKVYKIIENKLLIEKERRGIT